MRSSSSAIRSSRSRSASSWRSPTAFWSTAAILRPATEHSVEGGPARDHERPRSELGQQALAGIGPRLEHLDATGGAELRESDARERLRCVAVDAETVARARQRPQRRARRRVAAEVHGGAVLAEA